MTYDEANSKLMSLKKGDFIWAVSDESLFKTYSLSCSDKCHKYLGYDPGDDVDYDDSMHCIEIASAPLVSKPVKMVLVGKFTNSIESSDVSYAFSSELYDASKGHYFIGQHILIPYNPWFSYNDKNFYFKHIALDKDIAIKVNDVFFTEEECIKECRERNNKNSRKIDLIKKTVNSMKKQLKDFMTSELYIDHEKKIVDDLKLKDT